LQNLSGNTALRNFLNKLDWAVVNGHKDVVCLLIESNADVTIKNSKGKTAGEEAFDKGFYDISEKISDVEQKLMGNIVQEDADDGDEDKEENVNDVEMN
jgi:ankyrin repeat protein